METKYESHPEWTFWIDEISNCGYMAKAKHVYGSQIEISGHDPEQLIEQIKNDASVMEAEIKNKIKL